MNFLILGFFWIFSEFIFDFSVLKIIQKGEKRVYFRAGPTWMRRGTQGHVAEPRGPTRAPAWRDVTNIYIYIYIYMYIYHYT